MFDLLSLIYPKLCVVCGRGGGFLCAGCTPKLQVYADHRALFVFNETSQKLVHEFKYNHGFWVRRFLRHVLRQKKIPAYEVVIPVPLHVKRLRQRGYNQSLLFARLVAAEFSLPLAARAMVRVKETPSQTGLKRPERGKSLQDAFRVVRAEPVAGKDVLLVDDVRTTGATLDEASKALKMAGARSVETLSIAIVI